MFDDEKRKRIILLCSDGGHVRPKNLKGILTDISTRGITIVTVGLGSETGSKISVYEDGRFIKWFEINEKGAVTRLSEEILSEISRMTGGKYIRANLNTELKGIFRDPGVVGKKIFSGGKDIFQIPLTLSIVLLSLRMWFER